MPGRRRDATTGPAHGGPDTAAYQHCSERHLHRYLSEFDFRYSNRARLGVDDVERTERAFRVSSASITCKFPLA
jgi:hypothetical protein